MRAANESEHLALVGAAMYQVACSLLGTGELADAERVLTLGTAKIVSAVATARLNCRPGRSAFGSRLIAVTARQALLDADQVAGQLGVDDNWLWTAFDPTNVAIHQLSVEVSLGNAHLLEAERVAEQAVSRNASARTLLGMLLARERRSATPGLRGLASRAGVLR